MYVFVHIFISTLNVMFSFYSILTTCFCVLGGGGRNKRTEHTVLYYALNGLPREKEQIVIYK